MRVKFKQKYYVVKGGKYLEWAENFRDRINEISKQHRAFLKEIGVKGWLEYPERPEYVEFEGKAPKEFTKPDKKRLCRPRKNSKIYEEFQQLEPLPNACREFCQKFNFNPQISDDRNSRPIGRWINPVKLYWFDPDGQIMLMIPDVEAYLDEFKADYVGEELKNLQYPTVDLKGLEEVSLEKWMLLQAEYKEANKDD